MEGSAVSNYLTKGKLSEYDNESISYSCFEYLALQFGFQQGSVDNQREHLILLLENFRVRYGVTNNPAWKLHLRVFQNYRSWCEFLNVEPEFCDDSLHMDLALYFLIWGESANIRAMPEALCFIYHELMKRVRLSHPAQSVPLVPGDFLNRIVRPLYEQCSDMNREASAGHSQDHTKVRNYDDLNEFFWRPQCLKYSVYEVSAGLRQYGKKTFMEHRSVLTLILNYYRIFYFNIMMFVVISVLAFCVSISPDGAQGGLQQFGSLGETVEGFTSNDITLSLIIIPLTHGILSTVKCLFEIAQGWRILDFSSYTGAVFFRLFWNALGTICFILIVLDGQTDYWYIVAAIFLAPGLSVLILQNLCPRLVQQKKLLRFIREGHTSYVGRNMSSPKSVLIQYSMFWVCIWLLKFIVSYTLLIRPLMLPSISIYEMTLNSDTAFGTSTSLVILALWLPVFFVFLYDTQIYFTILQAVVGSIKGYMIKTGEVHGFNSLKKSFRVAPQLFDQKIVTRWARTSDASKAGEKYQTHMMLRFVVVWNEIVNSFRDADLVDDKEAAILQYDIQQNGEVFEPVFLSVGKLRETAAIIVRLSKQARDDSFLHIQLVKHDCISAIKSFYSACMLVLESLLGSDDSDVLEAIRQMHMKCEEGIVMSNFEMRYLNQLRAATLNVLEEILELPEPTSILPSFAVPVHRKETVQSFVGRIECVLGCLQALSGSTEVIEKLGNAKFVLEDGDYANATQGLLNLFSNSVAMGAATRAFLLLSLEPSDAMPRCQEAQRRLGFFMKTLQMDIPQVNSIREMHSFSVLTPFYAESVMFSLQELQDPILNHPIFQAVEEGSKNITILRYLTTIHPIEWENFLERIDVRNGDEALLRFPEEVRLWASYRGQTLARAVHGMMLYEDAIKMLHWLEIGCDASLEANEKKNHLDDIVRLKFSYILACQLYGQQRSLRKPQAEDIDFLLKTYPNLRVAYVDIKSVDESENVYDNVLVKNDQGRIVEVYRYALPGNPIIGEGKPENQNNALPFTRGEFVQTIDMNQEHYFEETLKMPHLLETGVDSVSIIGMREHIFTGNASSLAKFKTWQELVFVTLSQRVLADPLMCRMHYGHPDVFDKLRAISCGGVSKASRGINLSEDVFAGFNVTLRGGKVTHKEFLQCGKGRDVALSQISTFEGKVANGNGETSLSRDVHRLGQFLDFFRLHSLYYSHTGFYFATWLTVVTAFVYIYSKLYIALVGVEAQIIDKISSTSIFLNNTESGFESQIIDDLSAVINTQYIIQAGLFLTLPLLAVYLVEKGLLRGMLQILEMIITCGPAFFVFQVGTTSHYFSRNLLFGGGKYQATGRGFKISRESFVLLYKSYSGSHYKPAIELIGLCCIYLSFGTFNLCDDVETDFGRLFCTQAHGFGAKTFAIWFIAVIWIVSPCLFNTDGFEWQKTKADVKSWGKWMFMKSDEEDEDATNSGGWLRWWKSTLEPYQSATLITRLLIFAQECRHFLIMWYVVTSSHDNGALLFVFAAVVAFWIFLQCLSIFAKSLMKHALEAIFFSLVTSATIYFVIVHEVWGWSTRESLSIFFGFFSGLYGLHRILLVSITSSTGCFNVTQSLSFFFDFVFGSIVLLPMLAFSAVPFISVIQTRMMYNEGFSKVMSVSSQYAFSLCAGFGVFSGVVCGWGTFVLTTLDFSAEFIDFLRAYEISLGSGTSSYIVYGSATIGVFSALLMIPIIGHRLSIVVGGCCNLLGLLLLSSIQRRVASLIYPSLGFLGASIGIILPTILLYCHEISTKDFRHLSVALVGLGYIIGMLLGSYLTSGSTDVGRIWQLFWCGMIMMFVTPLVNWLPCSPRWIYSKYGEDACQESLILLRRQQDVGEELNEIKLVAPVSNLWRKLSLILGLQLCYSMGTNVLNVYIILLSTSIQSDNRMLAHAILLQLLGAILGLFLISRIPHRTMLLCTLLPIGGFVIFLGMNDPLDIWNSGSIPLDNVLVFVIYFLQGVSLTTTVWLSAMNLFEKGRTRSTCLSFVSFFACPAAAVYLREYRPDLYYAILIGYGCLAWTISIFLAVGFMSRKSGGLSTRSEALSSAMDPFERLTILRNRHFSRSRNWSSRSSNYALFESPGASRNNLRLSEALSAS